MRRSGVLAFYKEIEITEHDWLICSLLWITIGTLALSSLGIIARASRLLFAFMLFVHTVEAIYVAFRAQTAGFSAGKWFFRTMVLGSLALFIIEVHLRKTPHRKLLK